MMVLVIKLTSFAWSVHDGQVYNYNKTNIKDDEKKKLQSRHQIENRVTEMPGLLAFYGYVFFFGGENELS